MPPKSTITPEFKLTTCTTISWLLLHAHPRLEDTSDKSECLDAMLCKRRTKTREFGGQRRRLIDIDFVDDV